MKKNSPDTISSAGKISGFLSTRKLMLSYLGVYLILSLLFLRWAGQIINPDGVIYIAVAHHYVIGDFQAAINGIVSPLLSWMLIVPVSLSHNPFFFFRFILVGLSVLVIVGFDSILRRELRDNSKRPYVYNAALLLITAFCIYATLLTPLTPDLFSVFFAICLIITIRRYESNPSWLNALLIGASAGLGYYGKNYFGYFAIAAFALYFVIKLLQSKSRLKELALHFVVAFIVALAFMGAWIGLMSLKYGHITINPIGRYVIGVVGPDYPGAFYRVDGLLQPPYPDSFDSREDPTFYKYSRWSPLASVSDIKYYLGNVIPSNLNVALKTLYPELIVIATLVVIAIFESGIKGLWGRHRKASLLIAAAMVYVGGYCLIDLAGGFRYIWPAYIMLGLAVYLIISDLRSRLWPYLLVASTLVLSAYPILEYYQPAKSWAKAGHDQLQMASSISDKIHIPKHSRIASNQPLEAAYACYHLELQCYGSPVNGHAGSQYSSNKIEYIFNYNYTKPSLPTAGGALVYQDKIVTIFKLSD
jgi:hypothetical protein